MNHIEQCLAEVTARRDQLNELIDGLTQFATEPGAAPAKVESPPVERRPPTRRGRFIQPDRIKPVKESPPAPEKKNRAVHAWSGGTQSKGATTALRQVLSTLPEPFNANAVTEALLEARPDLHAKLRDGMVRGTLQRWMERGDLILVTPGRPHYQATFRRAKGFTAELPRPVAHELPEKEAEYRKFRETITVPRDADAGKEEEW